MTTPPRTLNGRHITTHEATVKTATVAIKMLTIGARQVTLAVFRQLIEAPLVEADTAALQGVPWGHVNYHPDKCGDDAVHLHVVWQAGEELRRSYVAQRWPAQESRRWEVEQAERQLAGPCLDLLLLARAEANVPLGSFREHVDQYGQTTTRLLVSADGWTFARHAQGYSGGTRDAALPHTLATWLTGLTAYWLEPQTIEDDTTGARKETPSESLARVRAKSLALRDMIRPAWYAVAQQFDLRPKNYDLPLTQRLAISNAIFESKSHDVRTLKEEFERDRQDWAKQYRALEQLDQLFIAI